MRTNIESGGIQRFADLIALVDFGCFFVLLTMDIIPSMKTNRKSSCTSIEHRFC
ncbi:hypothetical protein GTGU_00582 [Trabulsiella guamensis ATCC 49490]|uniref:Uncharacterized protein n=1 Tax=Trabulsiella guamensis ATCC 49490 TaxID=1005994 RepID=A0A085AJY7_9ENTR|nr:hypothetical protein GTGU_00582 [Trabulsiella guamensis ATCC 49490]